MNYFSRYKEYLKDNPQGYWFKRKVYGWGWVPATFQGWITLLVFIVVLASFITPLASNPVPTNSDIIWFFGKSIIWIIILLVVCFITGERPKWQWGLPKDKK